MQAINNLVEITRAINSAPTPWQKRARNNPVKMDSPFNRTAEVKAWVAKELGITTKRMEGRQQARRVVHARHVAMYICSKVLGRSSTPIGVAFNRDHTSVLHAIANIKRREPNIELFAQQCAKDLGIKEATA